MSQMNTVPVLKCRRCGKPVMVTHLSTVASDVDGEVLGRFMASLNEIAYCPFHLRQRNYYAKIGRMEDWEAGRP